MNKNKFNDGLFEFIEKATCSFTCINIIKSKLINKGYIELCEGDKWNIGDGRYFVIRNDSSIIVFNIGENYKDSFNIICTHSDTPGFCLKPKSEMFDKTSINLYN